MVFITCARIYLVQYNLLIKNLKNLNKNFNIKIIGKTKLKRNIYAVERFLNKDFFTAVFVASVHARENITTDLVVKFLEENLFENITNFNISIVPMLNPDGVELCYKGLESVDDKILKHQLFKYNEKNLDFSMWKANALGVDINNNFDAGFGKNVSKKAPSGQGYAGEYPESEKETQVVEKYIKSVNPFIVLAYHSKGEEIYFNYFQQGKILERDSLIAKKFAGSTGYKIKNVENFSSGGLKDWIVEKLKIPALTIEIGSDELLHPIKKENLDEIYQKNKTIANDLDFAYNVFMKYE